MSITKHESTELALSDQQSAFTARQIAALEHMGVAEASEADLGVFFHVCKRSGLDPFARQIYMISRQARENVNGDWQYVTKQTIQTGIDGFRLIGRRAADKAGHKIRLDAPEWAKDDGTWRPVWSKAWGLPVAARVTIHRDGEPFTAIALFDEYAQTNRNGDLTAMWKQRSAGQLAKCAEALAWRMAFPQDLSGIYTDEEMGQADNTSGSVRSVDHSELATGGGGLAAVLDPSPPPDAATSVESPGDPSAPAETSGGEAPDEKLLNTRSALAKRMYATLNDAKIPKEDWPTEVSAIINRTITSSKEITEAEASAVIGTLEIRSGEKPAEEPVDAELVEDES